MRDDGYFYMECLKHALTKGVTDYGMDTKKRSDFVNLHTHLLAGTYLVSMFAYLESTLGEEWMDIHGGKQKKELYLLKFIRNAFVHKNSHLRDLGSHTPELEQELRDFIEDLGNGKIKDDKGNIYPCYMKVSSDGVVCFNEHAIRILSALGRIIAH